MCLVHLYMSLKQWSSTGCESYTSLGQFSAGIQVYAIVIIICEGGSKYQKLLLACLSLRMGNCMLKKIVGLEEKCNAQLYSDIVGKSPW